MNYAYAQICIHTKMLHKYTYTQEQASAALSALVAPANSSAAVAPANSSAVVAPANSQQLNALSIGSLLAALASDAPSDMQQVCVCACHGPVACGCIFVLL
jgi:hypothetical protein